MARTDNPTATLRVAADFLQAKSEDKRPAVAAYAFSDGGRLLAYAPLGAQGDTKLELPATRAPFAARVLLGPAPEEKEVPALDELLRRGAIERHVTLRPGEAVPDLRIPVFPDIWRYWLLGLCLVKGTVLKRVTRDGVAMDFPVCHATVEIYEVDPLWILLPKLPPYVVAHLRDILAGKIPPRPLPGPGPVESTESHQVDEASLEALHAAAGNQALRYAAMSGSNQMFQQALVNHATLIRPILCWLYPRFVTMQLIGTVATDDCGHFARFIFKGYRNPDQPDLYFKVKQRIFGFFEATLYAPTPIACHTWWDYRCGTEVTLHVTNPLAITCTPCAPVIAGENWVLFNAIGNHALSDIRGSASSLSGTTDASNVGLTGGGAPWGGVLMPRLDFDNSLRDALGVKYYRLSWKRDGEPDSQYKPLNAAISRHYAQMIGTDLVLTAYPLGPQVAGSEGNLFEIPPAVPPAGQWSVADAVEDTANGKFDTTTALGGAPILDGLVQLRLELFDAAGLPVNIGALGIDYYVPTYVDGSGNIHTIKASDPQLGLGAGLVQGSAMVLTLHVNNEPCSAHIGAPMVGGTGADDCCGVLGYHSDGDNVTMPWQASHPHGFATYGFLVRRGARDVLSDSGAVGGGSFSETRSVGYLMTTNPAPGCTGGCTVAGFTENLSVYAMATNGWGRLSNYDGWDARAFVLSHL